MSAQAFTFHVSSLITRSAKLFIAITLIVSITSFAQDKQIRKSIFFDGGSAYIDEFQAADLAHWLDSIPNLLDKYEIQLISHTDNIGSRRSNQILSRMRSEAVFELLIQKDIPEKVIHIKDWGFENPVYENTTYKGLIMNRRVDVILHPVVF
ncbi:MAG: OmpA family protein [Cyclobacteriaceae bacterium]|nr:OmpA family protein [Cyclobacteriaceae bacterium]